ncbi:MAG: nucleoside-diphosphate kinase [Candidatus Altiarchaeales archaeon]|nr:nucleoside-diphosphate kinase [Candidatus Altiarchaeales archaeon]
MRTLIIIRPYAVIRGLVGEIISRFERHGIRIAGIKVLRLSKVLAEKLYREHEGKNYYDSLIENMTSKPSVFAVLDIDVLDDAHATSLVRKIIGDTDPALADMGTIRGDFGLRIDQNIIHASDSPDAAQKEIPLFFDEKEIVEY